MKQRPETPKLTTDAVIHRQDGLLLFVRRGNEPFKGKWGFPGGFVDVGERVEDACRREVREETTLEVEIERLLGIYSDPTRDPRGHTVSVVYLCRRLSGEAQGGDDAAEAAWLHPRDAKNLAFDHDNILADALAALKTNSR